MIDVPVEVKDALRDGRLKKNYRFVLGEEEWHEVGSFETIGWYSPSTSYGDDKKYTIRDAKTYRFVVDDADHDTYTLYIYKGTDPNWRTVEATSRNTWDITLINEAYAYVEVKSSSGNYYSPVSVQNFFAYTIDNNNLVSESVSIDERMCSGDTLKFGLCEGSSLEFQYFDFPNITGQRIQAFVDVESEEMEYSKIYELKRSLYSLPADGRYKITATSANMANIFDLLFVHGTTTTRMEFTVAQDGHGEIEIPNAQKGDDIFLDYRSGTTPTAEVFQWVHKWHTIPMGFFDVKKCSRQASTGIIKVTAYNKLQSEYLDAKANILINDFSADGISDDGITVNTIIEGLLGDYKIKEKTHGTTYSSIAHNSVVQISSVKLKNQSGTYRLMFSSVNTSAEPSNFQTVTGKIIELKNIDKYCDYVIQCVDSFYAWIQDKFQNANSLWESIKPILQATLMPVIFTADNVSYTYVSYFPSKYITSNTVTYEGKTYHVRPLEGLYRLNKPEGYYSAVVSLWQQLFSSAWVLNSSSVQVLNWEFNDISSYNDKLPDIYIVEPSSDGIGQIELSKTDLPDVTLRDLQTAVYETQCQFGQLDRVTDLFSGVELNHSRLYPADNLYPADTLYPYGAAASATKSMYSKLWADEGNIHKWRYLIITYKGLNSDNQKQDFTLQRTVNADGTDDYNMSDNWLFRNLIWTAADVGDYADAMVAKMQDITWFPFEMWCAGLPYLETGDEIEIPLGEHSYTSYILQRQLKGIQNLQDTYINGTLDIF